MLNIMAYVGPFALPLAVLTLLIAGLIVRAAFQTKTSGESARNEAQGRHAAILFWGFVAAVLGFLGQCAALYRIMTSVVDAEAVSPEILAEGFAASFITTFWGVGLLLIAGLAWLSLRGLLRRRTALASMVALAAVGLVGCAPSSSPAPADLTQGVWAGDGGPDHFLFDLRGTAPDSLSGFVHVMRDGKMDSELAITHASYHPPDLEIYIPSTNATYTGLVDLSKGRIDGSLSFGGEPGPEMELKWTDPAGIPGFAGLAQDGTYAYRTPAQLDDGWQVATPEDADLERAALESLVNAVADAEAGLIHSLLVARSGRLVLEEYFHGYGADDLHRLASTTKSISSLLVGAAVDRGMISGVDTPITAFFPEATPGTGWEKETLRHVLTMSMGLDWTPPEAHSTHGTGPAFFQRVLSRNVVDAPGTKWDYVSANVNLLAGVIHKATEQHAEVFARETLFSPLGIRAYDWEYGKERGYNLMDGSLQLRPRDLAKIGAMVAQGGRWNGEQVISEAWIQESTRSQLTTGEPLGGYGDLWWTGELPCGHGREPIVVANGMGSQFIVVFPRLDLVVVTTGGNDDNGRHLDLAGVLTRTLLSAM